MVSKEIDEKKGWPTINLNKISVSKANVRTLNKTEKIDEPTPPPPPPPPPPDNEFLKEGEEERTVKK